MVEIYADMSPAAVFWWCLCLGMGLWIGWHIAKVILAILITGLCVLAVFILEWCGRDGAELCRKLERLADRAEANRKPK